MIDPATSGHYVGDCRELLRQLPDGCIQTCVSSPPFWGLRDYGVSGQIGLEPTPDAYVAVMVEVFMEVYRVLADDGTLWLNLGDSYSHGGCGARDGERWPKQQRNEGSLSLKTKHAKKNTGLTPKDLIGMPWRVAFALQAAGYYLRSWSVALEHVGRTGPRFGSESSSFGPELNSNLIPIVPQRYVITRSYVMVNEDNRPRAFIITLIGIAGGERRYRVTANALTERVGAQGDFETVAEGLAIERWTPDRCGALRWKDVEDLHEQRLAIKHVLLHAWDRVDPPHSDLRVATPIELGRQQVQP